MKIYCIIAALALGLALAGCGTTGSATTSEIYRPSSDAGHPVDVDAELYWHQRGTDATKCVWTSFRLRGDSSLLRGAKPGRPLGFWFSAQAFDVLLDSVGSFWRRDLASDAVAAYFGDMSVIYPDRSQVPDCDGVMRWAIACTRASRITGDRRYLEEARALYDNLWLSQVDNALGGGMWRRTDERAAKTSAANFSATVAALNLYFTTQDLKYLLQGKRLYQWAAERLYDPDKGAVFAGLDKDGNRDESECLRDAGTFVGASLRLYRATGTRAYLANARRAADRLVELLDAAAAAHGPSLDESASVGTAVRYLAEIARRQGNECFREWLLDKARSAWTSRRMSDGLNGRDWTRTPTDAARIETQTALSAAMLYFATSRAFR